MPEAHPDQGTRAHIIDLLVLHMGAAPQAPVVRRLDSAVGDTSLHRQLLDVCRLRGAEQAAGRLLRRGARARLDAAGLGNGIYPVVLQRLHGA